MKFTVLQSNFSKSLNQVARVVTNRASLPVLSNVLITAEKGKIKLSTTDLEVAITSQTTGKIEEDGQLTVPARILSDFISNNTDESIEFTTDNNSLILKSNRFEATINGISAEEFPTVPEISKEVFCSIEKDVFIDSLKKVVIAPANDETRPVLAGIYFNFKDNILTLAATDSYRLAEKKIVLTSKLEDKSYIVPSRTMNEVIRLLSASNTKEISIHPTENQVAFIIGETCIISRLIEGAFPNYAQIIPANSKVNIEVPYAELLSAIKMEALFAKESSNNIKFIIKENEIIISTTAGQTGRSQSKVEAKVTGGEMEIAFNVRYIMDVLQIISSDSIIFKLNDDSTAGVICTNKDKGYLYVVMPLKLDK